ncbi:hypothetical protein FC89_GL000299 [Liquorilactobacillus ghanensis DSM 18630]|uniref:Uncharacterized protein n=1 Tax=Liquorilactobacillus ghanensis DSM 18630 TaxID=1423750 RepID=A0A0R1VMF4_9LACO|nr:hypothetical protein [Liquorilactobacillus ghanensis]KRM06990.1 hypothetical protein FC89_GL000299 [Liquorilactobacillus ghanensis DSM 18630]
MNWSLVFADVQKWMQASNVFMQQHPLDSQEYWHWLVGSLAHLEQKYDSHPLVIEFCVALMNYQEYNWKKLKGEEK